MPSSPDIDGIYKRFGDQPILFELIPPTKEADASFHENRENYLHDLFDRLDVGALNLPEVQEESKKDDKGQRRSDFKERVSPREYTRQLSDQFDELNFVINRVIVKHPRDEQETWLRETYHDYGIENIILVGGESSDVDYPGPSVADGNRLIKESLNEAPSDDGPPTDFRVGNICISTRRKDDFDEPERMIKKIRAGADFFTTQIVAEKDSPLELLRDLSHSLQEENVDPPTIFWSFSPIAEQKDVDFLRWLGVKIPESVEDEILSAEDPVATSIQHARTIWEALNDLNQELELPIPIGLNISFMGDRNFRNAIDLAEQLQLKTASPS